MAKIKKWTYNDCRKMIEDNECDDCDDASIMLKTTTRWRRGLLEMRGNTRKASCATHMLWLE